jgi:predicted  nucleic acid-binding Zn-ribbon protein
MNMNITESELYQIIGELFVARALTDNELKAAHKQIYEMSQEITRLRSELNGELVKSANNDSV